MTRSMRSRVVTRSLRSRSSSPTAGGAAEAAAERRGLSGPRGPLPQPRPAVRDPLPALPGVELGQRRDEEGHRGRHRGGKRRSRAAGQRRAIHEHRVRPGQRARRFPRRQSRRYQQSLREAVHAHERRAVPGRWTSSARVGHLRRGLQRSKGAWWGGQCRADSGAGGDRALPYRAAAALLAAQSPAVLERRPEPHSERATHGHGVGSAVGRRGGVLRIKVCVWFWRPQSAIPLADTDGNNATVADAGWLPVVSTPNHPEYPAAHACAAGATAEVLRSSSEPRSSTSRSRAPSPTPSTSSVRPTRWSRRSR